MSYWYEHIIHGYTFVFAEGGVFLTDKVLLLDNKLDDNFKIALEIALNMSQSINIYCFTADNLGVDCGELIDLSRYGLDQFLESFEGKSIDHSLLPPQVAQAYELAVRKQKSLEIQAARKTAPAGFVYLLRSASGYYKIGRSKNPYDRLTTFEVKLPFEVEYEHLIETTDMYQLEKELHRHFADKRVNGEWFELTPEDVAYIKSLNG